MDGDCRTLRKTFRRCGKIDEGYDIAPSGWRKERVDNAMTRKIPSRIANANGARFGYRSDDFGTTFQSLSRDVLKDVHCYGALHPAFIQALPALVRCAVAEVDRSPERTRA